MSDAAPHWFRRAIGEGLQALVVLHLPGGPAADTVGYTRDVWVRTLWEAPVHWDESADAKRLQTAFGRLARQADRWPPPRALLEALPAREHPPALPAPAMSAEQREHGRQSLDYLRKQLARVGARKP